MKLVFLAVAFISCTALGCASNTTTRTALPTATRAKKTAPAGPGYRISLSEVRPHHWRALGSQGEVVVAAGSDGNLRRVDQKGRFTWVTPVGLRKVKFVRVSGDERLVAVSEEKLLCILDASNGKIAHKLTVETAPTDALPDFERGRVYVAADKRLTAFDLKDGKVLWSTELPSSAIELLQHPTDGSLLAHTRDAVQWFTPDGVAQRRIELPGSWDRRARGSLSASGRYLTLLRERTVLLLDLQASQPPVALDGLHWAPHALRVVDDSRVEVLENNRITAYALTGARLGKPTQAEVTHNAQVVFGSGGSIVQAYADRLSVLQGSDPVTSYELPVTSLAANEQHALLALGVHRGAYVFDVKQEQVRYLDVIAPPIALSPNGQVLAGIEAGGIALVNLAAAEPHAEPLGYAPSRSRWAPARERAHDWSWLLFISDDLLLSSTSIKSSWMWSRAAGGVVRFLDEGGKPSVTPGGRVLLFADRSSLQTVRAFDGEPMHLIEMASPVAVTPRKGRLAAAKSPGIGSPQTNAPGVELSRWFSNDDAKPPYAIEETLLKDCTAHALSFDAAGQTLAALCVSGPDEYTLVAYDLERRQTRFSVTIPMEEASEVYSNEPRELLNFRGALLLRHRGGLQVYDWREGRWRGEIRLLPEGGWVVASADGHVDGTENALSLLRGSGNLPGNELPRWAELRTPNLLGRVLSP